MPRWSNIPAARSSAARLNVRLYAVLGALLVAAAAGLMSMLAWIGFEPPPQPELKPEPVALAEAHEVANAFIEGRTSLVVTSPKVELGAEPRVDEDGNTIPLEPFAGAAALNWQGFVLGRPNSRQIETHRFLVTGPGLLQQLTVVMELTANGPVLVAAPSLEPVTVPAAPPERFDWSNATNVDLDPKTEARAREWAVAYLRGAQGDAATLQDLTGDLEGRTFPPLGGLTAVENRVETLSAARRADGLTVVRVVVPFTQGNYAGTLEYDLLVRDADTTDPRIVAWGPPGSGGALAEFQNALTGS